VRILQVSDSNTRTPICDHRGVFPIQIGDNFVVQCRFTVIFLQFNHSQNQGLTSVCPDKRPSYSGHVQLDASMSELTPINSLCAPLMTVYHESVNVMIPSQMQWILCGYNSRSSVSLLCSLWRVFWKVPMRTLRVAEIPSGDTRWSFHSSLEMRKKQGKWWSCQTTDIDMWIAVVSYIIPEWKVLSIR